MVLSYILTVIVTIIIWSFISYLVSKHFIAKYGTLKIDHSDPEKDVHLFEVSNLNSVKKKYVMLKVDHNADLSQK